MKTLSVILLLVLGATVLVAQEEESEWRIMPSVAIVKFFPGEDIQTPGEMYMPTYPVTMPYVTGNNYAGTGLNFSARCFSDDIKPLALTFGGGITWYYQPDQFGYPVPAYSPLGVGATLGRQDFTAFPLSIGVQAVFPYASRENLMVFAGAEGNLQFISGNLAVNQQAKAGYTVLGGFAVKFLEFGIRYTAFSDIKNLGAHFGIRFKSFGI